MLPAYRQMAQTWLAVGPVHELAQAIANLVIGDPVLNRQWIAKWRQFPRENMGPVSDCMFACDDVADRLHEITCPGDRFRWHGRPVARHRERRRLCAALAGCACLVSIERGPHASNLTDLIRSMAR